MRSVDTATLAALASGRLVARNFLTITAVDRTQSVPVPVTGCFWNDVGPTTINVISGVDGTTVSRTYAGSGGLIEVDDIPLVNDLTVQSISVALNHLSQAIDTLIRAYDMKQAPVEIHRGLYDPTTRALVAPASLRFVGYCDGCEIDTPLVEQAGGVKLTLVSDTRELTRQSTDKRSDASQRLRDPTDSFFQYNAVIANVQIFWGQASSTTAPIPPKGIVGGLNTFLQRLF